MDLYGVANFVTFLQNTSGWRRRHRALEYGSLEDHLPLLNRISPINHIDKMAAPLFLVGGEQDMRVPISETLQVHEKVRIIDFIHGSQLK